MRPTGCPWTSSSARRPAAYLIGSIGELRRHVCTHTEGELEEFLHAFETETLDADLA